VLRLASLFVEARSATHLQRTGNVGSIILRGRWQRTHRRWLRGDGSAAQPISSHALVRDGMAIDGGACRRGEGGDCSWCVSTAAADEREMSGRVSHLSQSVPWDRCRSTVGPAAECLSTAPTSWFCGGIWGSVFLVACLSPGPFPATRHLLHCTAWLLLLRQRR